MPFSTIRMIVMDLDDTLISGDLSISEENKRAISNAKAAGITIVLASGRPTPAMVQFANDLELQENGYIISYNGAYVTDWSNQDILFDTCLTKEECDLLVDTALAHNVNIHTYVDGDILTNEMNPHTDFEAELTGMPIRLVDDLKASVTHKVPKVLIVSDAERVKQTRDILGASLGHQFMISISKPVFLEFTNKNVDKSRAIDVLCERLNIEKQQVMAIGDSYNDLTMLRDCGVGVAMGNAPDDIKALADVVTDSYTDNGVASIIAKVLSSSRYATQQ